MKISSVMSYEWIMNASLYDGFLFNIQGNSKPIFEKCELKTLCCSMLQNTGIIGSILKNKIGKFFF